MVNFTDSGERDGVAGQEKIKTWMEKSDLYKRMTDLIDTGVKQGKTKEEIELELQLDLPNVKKDGDTKSAEFLNFTVDLGGLIDERRGIYSQESYGQEYSLEKLQERKAEELIESGDKNWSNPLVNQPNKMRSIEKLYGSRDEASELNIPVPQANRLSRDELSKAAARSSLPDNDPLYIPQGLKPTEIKSRLQGDIEDREVTQLGNSELAAKRAVAQIEQTGLYTSRGEAKNFVDYIEKGGGRSGSLKQWGIDDRIQKIAFEKNNQGRITGFTTEGKQIFKLSEEEREWFT